MMYTVLVTWTNGRTELVSGLTADQIHALGEDPTLIRLEACPLYIRDRFRPS